MGLSGFQADVVGALQSLDQANDDLLAQVVTASNALMDDTELDVAIADVEEAGDLNDNGSLTDEFNDNGYIDWGGMQGSIAGTSGVALLEYAKDAIQTAVSNVSGVGTNQIKMNQIAARKFQA